MFFVDYQNFSRLFAIDRIPFRLIALRQAIRKHMTYASIALRGTKTDTIKQFDHAIYTFISFSRESAGQRAAGVLIVRITERELRKRTHVRRPSDCFIYVALQPINI